MAKLTPLQEALLHWKAERSFLYTVGNYLPQDMKRAQEAIERLNKEIELENNRGTGAGNHEPAGANR